MVISGAERVHVHMIVFCSDGCDFSLAELFSNSSFFCFCGRRMDIHGSNLFKIKLHCVPPSLTSISDLIGELGCNGKQSKQISYMTRTRRKNISSKDIKELNEGSTSLRRYYLDVTKPPTLKCMTSVVLSS